MAGSLSNLGKDDRHLADRMRKAIDGEIARRYRLFKDSGARDANEYEEMRLAGRDLEPVPILLVIIDEYLELFHHHPDWIDLVIHIGQEGRGCNVFFTLGGQRLDLSSLSKAKSNIAFRVALRAETAEDSRDVIGSDAALHLPAGENRLMAQTQDSLLKIDGLVLSAPPLGSTDVGTPRSLLIDRWRNDDRIITVGEGAQGLLVVNEIFNRGWVAMLNGNRLDSTEIDGWRQAFVVPAGSGGTVRLTYTPNRSYRILTGLGFLLLVLMVVLAFIGRRSKDASDPIGPRQFPDWVVLLLVAGVAIWVVGLAALAVPLVWLLRRWRNWSTPFIAALGVLIATAIVANSPNRLGLRSGWSSLESWVTSVGAAVAFLCVIVNLLPDRRGGEDLQYVDSGGGDD